MVFGKTIPLEAKTKTGRIIHVELSISKVKLNGLWNAIAIVRKIEGDKR